jgi:hypothetical protein
MLKNTYLEPSTQITLISDMLEAPLPIKSSIRKGWPPAPLPWNDFLEIVNECQKTPTGKVKILDGTVRKKKKKWLLLAGITVVYKKSPKPLINY